MSFVGKFFLLVVLLSVGEFYLLLLVSANTGVLFTLSMCVLTGVLGGHLVRRQGLSTLRQIQNTMSMGRLPATEIISGLILLVIGTLLLTPGFITDTIAFLMLIPPLRALVASALVRMFGHQLKTVHMGGVGGQTHQSQAYTHSAGFSNSQNTDNIRQTSDGIVIDAEVIETEVWEQNQPK